MNFGKKALKILKPAYIIWMKIVFVLSWINARIILLFIFYLLFTPVAIAMKVLRKDPLDRKIEKNKESYWGKEVKCGINPINYERQF